MLQLYTLSYPTFYVGVQVLNLNVCREDTLSGEQSPHFHFNSFILKPCLECLLCGVDSVLIAGVSGRGRHLLCACGVYIGLQRSASLDDQAGPQSGGYGTQECTRWLPGICLLSSLRKTSLFF